MGLIDREIIQSLRYENEAVKAPSANYSEVFPITVFDAVRESMGDPNSSTLSEILAGIKQQLDAKQPLLPGKSGDYLMTFAGIPGGVGSIKIAHNIPWDPDKQSQERIPTEKAIGELMRKIGLVDDDGKSLLDPNSRQVRWSDIVGRPLTYESIGYNDDGFMTQKAVSEELRNIKVQLSDLDSSINSDTKYIELNKKLLEHITDEFNPHKVNLKQIGAASEDSLKFHIDNKENPHNVTAVQIGLGNVDNTRDKDKPVSDAVQAEIDKIVAKINLITGEIGDLDYVVDASYDNKSGNLTLSFASGKQVKVEIPTDGLVDEITFDKESSSLIIFELGGNKKEVSLKDLKSEYKSTTGSIVNIDVDNENKLIRASVNDNSIGSAKIKNKSITNSKLADNAVDTINIKPLSITKELIAKESISTGKLEDRSVTGKKLFTSPYPHRLLGVELASGDPDWIKLGPEYFDDNIITEDKIVNGAVTNKKLARYSVTNDKIAENAINTENIINNSVTTDKLASSITLKGNPKLSVRPSPLSKDDSIPDTYWVKNYVENKTFDSDNIASRSVDGSKLFTSSTKDRVLAVTISKSDPVWTQVNNGMLADESVSESKLRNNIVSADKIKDLSVTANKLASDSVTTSKIKDGSVSFDKFVSSDKPDMIIGTDNQGKPRYTKVNTNMMESSIITNKLIQDGAVSPNKIQSSDTPYTVLGVKASNSIPVYTKIVSSMVNDGAITGRTLFRSYGDNKVLVTGIAGEEPFWGEINSNMIANGAITNYKLASRAVTGDKIFDQSITNKHISTDYRLNPDNVDKSSIPVNKLVTSPVADKVLAVDYPYGDPKWLSVSTNMIEDEAVTNRKLFTSNKSHRVLAATNAHTPPEYTLLTGDYIVDRSISDVKLEPNLVFAGLPSATVHPKLSTNDYHLATTQWVNWKLQQLKDEIGNGDISVGGNGNCSCDDIADDRLNALIDEVLSEYDFTIGIGGVVGGNCNCKPPEALPDDVLDGLLDEVLGSETSNGDITSGSCSCEPPTPISDDAFNSLIDEILGTYDHDVTSPSICECEPTPISNIRLDDLITEVYGNYYTNGNTYIPPLANVDPRSITGRQLFSSSYDHQVLLVTKAHNDAQWGKITNSYIADGVITKEKLNKYFVKTVEDTRKDLDDEIKERKSETVTISQHIYDLDKRVPDIDRKITNEITDRLKSDYTINNRLNSLEADNELIKDEIDKQIDPNKIPFGSIGIEHLNSDFKIGANNILDNAITDQKIAPDSIDSEHIKDGIQVNNITLTGHPIVKPTEDYQAKQVRNIIISDRAPNENDINFENGDIWFMYY